MKRPSEVKERQVVERDSEAVEKLAELDVAQDAVWVADTGMNTAPSREALGLHQIDWVMGAGRTKTKVAAEVLSCGGRFRQHPENPDLAYRAHRRNDRLFVVRLNRKERKRELRQIARHVAKVRETLAKDDRADEHSPTICRFRPGGVGPGVITYLLKTRYRKQTIQAGYGSAFSQGTVSVISDGSREIQVALAGIVRVVGSSSRAGVCVIGTR